MSKLSKINIFDSDWVDLVFKGRNQQYGAYVLRKKGDTNTNKGILYSIVFFTLVISTPMIIDWIKGFGPEEETTAVVRNVEVTTLEEPPPLDKNEPPPPPPPPPPPLKSTVKFTPPEIKKDAEVQNDEPPPIQEEMKDKDAGAQTVEGSADGVDLSLIEAGNGDGLTGEAEPEIVTFAEQTAEYPGGMQALYDYLGKNIVYPPMARDAGAEGRVILQFVIERDGKITDIQVLKKANWGFDEEAVRVVKTMKPWIPAKQNGKPVRLRYTLPVVFKLN